MPFRTRDFILFLLTIAFMIVGITSTVRNDLENKNHQATVIQFSDPTSIDITYIAVLPEDSTDERPSRLTALREKIAEVLSSDDSEPDLDEEVEVLAVIPTEEIQLEKPSANSVSLCSNYSPNTLNWNPKDLHFEIVEGTRIVYRDISSSTATVINSNESREVVLQLPLRTSPLSTKSCLKTDVVGIAFDGSLIRNGEQRIYSVFNSETIIGYALDGFPIYGLNNSLPTDECGGAIISGEYGYYLSTEREGVIGCFSGEPVGF